LKGIRPEAASALASIAISLVFLGSVAWPDLEVVRALLGSVILIYLVGLSIRLFLRLLVEPNSTRPLWHPAGIAMDLFVSLAISTIVSLGWPLHSTWNPRG
jgi:hypothetical protein